jgi:hypothetical protein
MSGLSAVLCNSEGDLLNSSQAQSYKHTLTVIQFSKYKFGGMDPNQGLLHQPDSVL